MNSPILFVPWDSSEILRRTSHFLSLFCRVSIRKNKYFYLMAYHSSKYRSADPIGPSCKKTMYHSREEAEEMIRHIQENRVTRPLHAYLCPVCGTWHLSSSPGE